MPCATCSKEQTGDIITFAQFEEGNLLTETHNDAESDDESDDDLIMPPLISEKKWMRWILAMNLKMNLDLQSC